METMEKDDQVHATRKKGGLITMPFIFTNEICEKLAVVGFHANLVSYLTSEMHMPLTQAATTVTNFGGTASLTPLIGAFMADAYIGRFWTITIASIIYTISMVCLTISAVLPQLRPPPCDKNQDCQEANAGQLAILYISLLLGALGSGGIRPCVVAFGADQFDESDPKQSTKTWSYFNWYYFAMGTSILIAVTVLVYIQDNIGWGWGLGIPTIAMFVSIVTFIIGYPLYRNLEPAGSPFTRLVQVIVAAYKKRKMDMVSDPSLLYQNDELDAPISIGGKLLHTKHMKIFDKAAIIVDEDELKSPNLWKISTVHRVEELKSLIRMGPIWASGILLITAYSQQGTFSLSQAKTMNRHMTSSFQIPAASMSVFTIVPMLLTVALYDRVIIPLARKLTGLDRGITFLHRMGIGFTISVVATLVAGFVEMKRKNVALEHGLENQPHLIVPISVFWLVPQYSLHGIAEAFMSIGHLEFFYDQAPESMRSTAAALFWTSIAAGNYLSTLLVSLVHKFTAGENGSDWLPDNNLNRGKLENFYWLITLLQVANLIYYLWCARIYTFKPIQVKKEDAKGESEVKGVEFANQILGTESLKNVLLHTYDTAQDCLETNYFGVKQLTETLVPLLQKSEAARIVNVSSAAGKLKLLKNEKAKKELRDVENLTVEKVDKLVDEYLEDVKQDLIESQGWPVNMSSYIVSKAALNAYTRVMAKKYPEIAINAVSPGHTKTDINQHTGINTIEESAEGPVKLALLADTGISGRYYEMTQESTFE